MNEYCTMLNVVAYFDGVKRKSFLFLQKKKLLEIFPVQINFFFLRPKQKKKPIDVYIWPSFSFIVITMIWHSFSLNECQIIKNF